MLCKNQKFRRTFHRCKRDRDRRKRRGSGRVFGQDLLHGLGVMELLDLFLGGEGVERASLGVADITQGFGGAVEPAVRQ